jgi:tetratricopeptide (TPR) repeat protein
VPRDAADGSEIDLSDEWEGALNTEAAKTSSADEPIADEPAVEPALEEISPAENDAVVETIEEIRFYLEHAMVDQARAAFVKLQSQTADRKQLAAIQSEIDAAAPAATDSEVPEVEVAEPEPETTAEPASPLQQIAADLDSSLGADFLPKTVTHEIEHDDAVTARAGTDPALVSHLEVMSGPKLSVPEPAEKSGVLGEFVADLENSLGDGFLQDAPVATSEAAEAHSTVPQEAARHAEPAPAAAAHSELQMAASAVAGSGASQTADPVSPPAVSPAAVASAAAVQPAAGAATFRASVRPTNGANAAASVDLADMFGEIRHELEEEVASAEQDPETHYNLGVAFREMGLLDEAIGELQKVCQAIDHGNPFKQVMQTYTWLAQCFLDKGVPEAAIRWYEKALTLPSLDQETRTALHYELASAYETAQDKNTALRHFMEVYGSNIDYRDVGERIKALKS